jgi:tRNA modification GTPase
MSSENSVILLTPPGPAAIAVVRLTGPAVTPFLARHFARPAPPGRCVHGVLRDERGEVLDDPVVVRPDDHDVADLSLHGGAWVVQSVINLAARAGFVPAEGAAAPSEAVDAAGTLEREVFAHLPLARTEAALRTLLAQPQAWAALKARAATPGGPAPGEFGAMLSDPSLTHLLHPPRVAIVGAPNVGKSTLANRLFAQERSITADVPGTTRDWVGELANIDGLAVTLVDTPGIRETPDRIEREAIDRSRAEVSRADLVVLVLDATAAWNSQPDAPAGAFPDAVRVLNKADRSPARPDDPPDAIRTVATIGDGVDLVRRAILERFGCLDLAPARPRIWTARQRAIVARAVADPAVLAEI